MIKTKNSMMLVVGVLSTYLALLTPDWKTTVVAANNPGYSFDFTGNIIGGWIWLGRHSGRENIQRIWEPDWAQSTGNWVIPRRTYPPDWSSAMDYDVVAIGDFNGDSITDWLWRATANGDGRWKVWQIQNGTRVGQNNPPNFDAAHDYTVIGSGDTDGDGDDDVIMQHSITEEIIIWEMNNYALTDTHNLGSKPGYYVAAVGDFDSDGNVDLLLKITGGNTMKFWELQNNSVVQEIATQQSGDGFEPVCSGDFDNDGDADLYLLSASGQSKYIEYESFVRIQQIFGANQSAFILLGCNDFEGGTPDDMIWTSADGLGYNRITTIQNFQTSKTYYTNRYGGTDPSNPGYGFEYRGDTN